jgi:hypothetical protein
MAVYKHVFRCQRCGGLVSNETSNPDCDNPRLPSLFHAELAKYVEDKKPINERRLIPPNILACYGRMLWLSSERQAAPVHVPVVRTVLDYSQEFTQGPQQGGVNTICAALDIATGTHRKGVNGHGTPRHSLHPTLRGILNGVAQLENWNPNNCAEIDAVNKLLNAGALRQNIRVHSRYNNANPKPPCENCQGWLASAEGGSYKIR